MLNYKECLVLIQKARATKRFYGDKSVKLGNNTYLVQNETEKGVSFQVIFHATAIVTLYQDNTFRLKTGGWWTKTTQGRLNEYSPIRINVRRGVWRLANNEMFQDGMVVDLKGKQTKTSRIELNQRKVS